MTANTSDDPPLPEPTTGPELARARGEAGVSVVDLAARLGVHRVTLHVWEREARVDAVRAGRYRRALRELVAEAIAQ